MEDLAPRAVLSAWKSGKGESLRNWLTKSCALHDAHRRRLIAWQEELDWQTYEAFGLVENAEASGTVAVSVPEGEGCDVIPEDGIQLGQRAFEIVMARKMAAGELQTTWFERHKQSGSAPITEIPSHWPMAYRELVERRIRRIETDSNIRLIEQPEYKRRWNTETWEEQFDRAARGWLLARLEGYFFEGQRVCDLSQAGGEGFDPAARGFIAATRPCFVSANQLADLAQSDRGFMEVAENYVGSSGFSVSKLVRELVESESVPYLPVLRYKDSGLRKRMDWEHVWELQRREDRIDAEEKVEEAGIVDVERLRRQEEAKTRKQTELGDIPVPPKYGSGDFTKTSYWRLRGKLDVPKERWINYPGAERAGDDSLIIAWAGWDHLQQAQALAEYYLDAKKGQGWLPPRLAPLLAGLADLIPWLRQWHNAPDPNLGMGLGDYFEGFLEEQARLLGTTIQELNAQRFERKAAVREVRDPKKRRVRGGSVAKSEEDETAPVTIDRWQDRPFELLAVHRNRLTDYRMLVWPEILRQMEGDMEFEVFLKAYWLLSEPTKLETLGRELLPDLPDAWWRSRVEQVAKDEFLPTLKGSAKLREVKIWRSTEGVRFICWTGEKHEGPFLEAVDDARVALQIAANWAEDTQFANPEILEEELVSLESNETE